jgi:thiamine transport system permease protein
MVGDFWSHIDPRMAQAAQILGANRAQTLQNVTFPLILPAIITAALLVFIFNFTSFGVILVLGGPKFATLEVEIYYQTVGLFNLPTAAVLSVIQLICTLILTLIYTRLSSRLSRPLSLKPHRFTQRKLTTWRSRVFAMVMVSIILAILIAPLVALISRSFMQTNPEAEGISFFKSGITIDYYRELSINRRDSLFYSPPSTAIMVSLMYAGFTVLLALVLGLPAAFALTHDRQSLFNRFLDPVIMLPLGTSAVTLGLGFIIALSKPPLDLRASLLLIPIAHTLVAFPFVVRTLAPSLGSINPQIRDAARMLGASNFEIVKRIDLPIVGRALIVAAIFAFAISLGEFGATALISRPEYPTIPILIYRFLSQPGSLNYGQAMALSTILMMTIALSVLFIDRFRIANVGEF